MSYKQKKIALLSILEKNPGMMHKEILESFSGKREVWSMLQKKARTIFD